MTRRIAAVCATLLGVQSVACGPPPFDRCPHGTAQLTTKGAGWPEVGGACGTAAYDQYQHDWVAPFLGGDADVCVVTAFVVRAMPGADKPDPPMATSKWLA